MKIPRTFLITFAGAALVLLIHTAWPQLFGLAWAYSFMIFYVAAFAALILVVGADLGRPRKITRTGVIIRVAIASLVAIVLALSLVPAFQGLIVVVISIASILIFAGGLCLLVGSVLWSCFRDYVEICFRRPAPKAPREWHLLEAEQLPAPDAAANERAKERFAHSYAVDVVCRPRAGAMGLISQPLKMDE